MLIGLVIALSVIGTTNTANKKVEVYQSPLKCSSYEKAEDRILCRLNYYSELLVKLAPKYIWGGFWGLLGGDCSGQVYWICKMAGLPVNRTTSLRMWLDKGGWPGERILVVAGAHEKAQFATLGFFDYSKTRPRGHVVFVVFNTEDKNGRRQILFREASYGKKIFKETIMKEGDYNWVHLHGILIMDLTPGFEG